jgi:hypothetical protein
MRTKELQMITTRAASSQRAVSAFVALGCLMLVVSCRSTPQIAAKAALSTYYVSGSGNDAATGTSPATAWRTLGRASSATLAPGSRLLLQGGKTFDGQLTLDDRDAGSGSDPVIVGSYGSGVATIHAVTGSGLYVHDTAGVDIENLNVVGGPQPGGSGTGINVYNDLPSGHRLDHIEINNITVTGFVDGIAVGGKNSQSGFGDVDIQNSNVTGNLDTGLETYGPTFNPQSPTYANQDVQVSHVVADKNHGDPGDKTTNTGNGIVLGSVHDGTISWSTATDNGGAGAAPQGPAGIWTYDSTGMDLEHNLSYDNKTPNRVDGNGFGLDQNTSDSVLQYNLSYGNDGTGYLVYSAKNDSAQKDNIVRYNISSNDARDGNTFYGGISVIGLVQNAEIYQNTVVMASTPTAAPPLLRLGPSVHGIAVRNNMFTTDSSPMVEVTSALPVSAALLQGNDYYSVAGTWQVIWGQTSYTSLSAWRAATSQEVKDGQPTGLDADPNMVGPVVGLQVTTPTDTSAGDAFALKPGSALIGAGLDIGELGMAPQPTDYTGKTESAGHPNVGAE